MLIEVIVDEDAEEELADDAPVGELCLRADVTVADLHLGTI